MSTERLQTYTCIMAMYTSYVDYIATNHVVEYDLPNTNKTQQSNSVGCDHDLAQNVHFVVVK